MWFLQGLQCKTLHIRNHREMKADYGRLFGALLTHLSQVFDCIPQDLIIAKLEAYCFQIETMNRNLLMTLCHIGKEE